MATKRIKNNSTLMMEDATQQECPRCKGVGYTRRDVASGFDCVLCMGKCRVWRTQSGWVLPVGAHAARVATVLW